MSGIVSCYKRCPSDEIVVVYKQNKEFDKITILKCLHGGGIFIWTLIKKYGILSLKPMTTDINLRETTTKDNVKPEVTTRFTFAISAKPELTETAAKMFLHCDKHTIISIASKIFLGVPQKIISTLSIEEINSNKEKFLEQIKINIEAELNKIGLTIIDTKSIL